MTNTEAELLQEAQLTPKEVEEQEVRQLETNLNNTEDPVEYAAALFSMYHERFVTLIEKLPTKALKRIILKNVLEPLEDTGFKYQSAKETDAGNLMNGLLEAKYLMILHAGVTEQERQEREKLETAQVAPEQSAVTEQKDELNG